MNILENLFQTTEQTVPLPHLGEAYGVWFYYVLCSSALSFCQLGINHARDPELKALLRQMNQDMVEPQMKRLVEFLTREGVPIPVDFPRHPVADPDSIPPGARMEDVETANILAMRLQSLLTTCAANMQQTLREDLGTMYVTIYSELLAQALRTKKLMQKRGWLILPPLYHPAGVHH